MVNCSWSKCASSAARQAGAHFERGGKSPGSLPITSCANDSIGYSLLVRFANNGTIGADHLRLLEPLAGTDDQVEDAERAVLHRIFVRVAPHLLAAAVPAEIAAFCARYAIGVRLACRFELAHYNPRLFMPAHRARFGARSGSTRNVRTLQQPPP